MSKEHDQFVCFYHTTKTRVATHLVLSFQANYLAMHSAIVEYRKWATSNGMASSKLPHIVTTTVEHCATELPLKHWEEQGLIGIRVLLSFEYPKSCDS